MIPTWLHGCIDYGVSALFGAAAANASLSPAIRRTIGAAGAYHAGYSLLTDYPAGVRPWLTMRQHLWLDTIGGLALCGAGLALRREPAGQRALLMAAGLAELAVVGCSNAGGGEKAAPPEETPG